MAAGANRARAAVGANPRVRPVGGGQTRRSAPTRVARAGVWLVLAGPTLAWPLLPFLDRYRPLREAHLGAGVLDVWRQTLKMGHMGDRVGRAIAGWAGRDHPLRLGAGHAAVVLPAGRGAAARRARSSTPWSGWTRWRRAAGRCTWPERSAGLADRWYPSCSDSLIALHTEPQSEMAGDATPLGIRLVRPDGGGAVLELAGYQYGEATFAPSTVVPLTLYWRAVEAPEHDYSVSLRLLDGAGQPVYQVDSQHPVLGAYPTSRWTAGQVVADYYEMQIRSRPAVGDLSLGRGPLSRAARGRMGESARRGDGGRDRDGGRSFD